MTAVAGKRMESFRLVRSTETLPSGATSRTTRSEIGPAFGGVSVSVASLRSE